MVGFAEVTLSGILVTDPQLLVGSAGPVASFTVAASGRRYDPVTGQRVDTGMTLLTCTIQRQAAENVAASLTRGTHVLITGVLRQREWDTTSGDQRYAYQLDATDVGISLNYTTVTITTATPDSPNGD
jgi:single-strand DNA-binding protein